MENDTVGEMLTVRALAKTCLATYVSYADTQYPYGLPSNTVAITYTPSIQTFGTLIREYTEEMTFEDFLERFRELEGHMRISGDSLFELMYKLIQFFYEKGIV